MILFLIQNYALLQIVHITVNYLNRNLLITKIILNLIKMVFVIFIYIALLYSSKTFARYFILFIHCSSVFPVAPTSIIQAAFPRC